MQKTVYQTDKYGLYMHQTIANDLALDPGVYNLPYLAVESTPPNAAAGKVAQWGGSRWALIDDYRHTPLWINELGGHAYALGSTVNVGGSNVTYPGWGTLPSWLTTTQPPPKPSSSSTVDVSNQVKAIKTPRKAETAKAAQPSKATKSSKAAKPPAKKTAKPSSR
ncbi:phage tail protein [Bordetella sp. LUAb4]|uniref:phage tail protein n=1 Tax=Bordetella sp. LUAb4 TaxID=2843195 RepID=UPI001E53B63F|nr:phage tail protein [Bordetella sp. LUAb4]